MIKMQVFRLVFTLSFLFFTSIGFSMGRLGDFFSDKITIASFNINVLGDTKIKRTNTFTVCARIASRYDIIALQEIGSSSSVSTDEKCAEIMDKYVAKINELAGNYVYSYVRGNQYAIVYKKDKVTVNSCSVYSGNRFTYPPLIANIKVNDKNFDFTLITIHTRPELAKTEIPALLPLINDVKNQYSEPDVICLGDYNADGGYYEEGNEEWLEPFVATEYITAIPNSFDTTVAEDDYAYDRIQMTGSLDTDYTGDSGVFIFGKEYDMSICEGSENRAGTEKAVSDHYPVWAKFYTDRDTD